MLTKANTLIVDGYGFAFRAYYTQTALTYQDMPVGCIHGFISMLMKLINDFQPLRAVVVFDHPGKTFRNDIYPEYKQHRPPVPEDLKVQLPILRNAAEALNFKFIEAEGFEADDIIASLAHKANAMEDRALIISSDKDLMQLVNSKIWMFDPVKQEYIKEQEVVKKFGIGPEQIVDFLSIVGDAADNVPGIRGLGPKAAAELLGTYHTLEGIYENLDKVTQVKRKENLINGKENAFLSKQLVVLRDNVQVSWTDLAWSPPEGTQILEFLQQYGLHSLMGRAEKMFHLAPLDEYRQNARSQNLEIQMIELQENDLPKIKQEIYGAGICGILIHQDTILLSCQALKVYQISFEYIDFVSQIMQDPSINKISFDLKSLMHKIKISQIASCNDVMLMYYSISTGNKQLSLADIIGKFFSVNQSGYSLNGNSCAFLCQLYQKLLALLVENKALYLYQTIDLPLSSILYEIENYGIDIDLVKLKSISDKFEIEARSLEQEILKMSPKTFNLASNKQLGEILFEVLKLPGGKKSGKSQNYTTTNEVLEKLSYQGFAIAGLIIDWRHLTKLKNTYTDSLPHQVNPKTGKLHTTFLQTNTSTARIVSIEPNLQNIPIRTKEGSLLRQAFIAKPGYKLICADYSQIELRILAEVANIDSMKEAFRQGLDIHSATASEVFGVPVNEVTDDLRRRAKAINFGIVYGMSSYGLAQYLNITNAQAATYIESYFAKYPEINQYFQQTKAFAIKHGFVENIFGRKCFISGINDPNFFQRTIAERAAINAPIQSSSADITKMAMIQVHKALGKTSDLHMLLQVHDSILLIAPEPLANHISYIIKDIMQNVVKISMPLTVDIAIGSDWSEL